MSKEMSHITIDELTANPHRIFDRVYTKRETVVVERDGSALGVITPPSPSRAMRSRRRKPNAADYAATRSTAGGWKDLVPDSFLDDLAESRRMPSRPPVEL